MPDKPTPEERRWLHERMAELIAEAGSAPFVSAPLIEQSDDWFPDPWSADPAGVQVLARRLMWHAGMRDLRAVVQDHRPVLAPSETLRLADSQVRYIRLEPGAALFDLDSLGEDDLPGIVSHEVGRAFLDHAQVNSQVDHPYRSSPVEGLGGDELAAVQLGSVATVYLGLGVMAANAAQSARHAGELVGNTTITQWSITTAGGLPAQALAYLLAVQAVVRGGGSRAHDSLLPNQRRDFDDWCDELEEERAELCRELGLPPESEWAPVPTSLTLVPFADEEYSDPDALPEQERRRFNRGNRVYRVRGTRSGSGLALGGLAGAILALPAQMAGGVAAAVAVMVAGGVVGALLGSRKRRDSCSEPECGFPLSAADSVCPRCGGDIAGEIKHADERLDHDEQASSSG